MALGAAGAAEKKERYVCLQAEQLQIPGMFLCCSIISSLLFSNPGLLIVGATIHTVLSAKKYCCTPYILVYFMYVHTYIHI